MFRLKAITPLAVPAEELARRQHRYDRLAARHLAVSLVNLPPGAPPRLDTADDVEASAGYVHREIERTSREDFDGILPDCVLDPCVGEIPAGPVPLFGILRLAAGAIAGLGVPFAAVTRNGAIGTEMARKLHLYGLAGNLDWVHRLEADFCLIADGDGWAAALAPAVAATAAADVPVLLNGCSAVDMGPDADPRVRVVDPTALALDVLAVCTTRGLAVAGGRAAKSTAPAGDWGKME